MKQQETKRVADDTNFRRWKDTNYFVSRFGEVYRAYTHHDRPLKPMRHRYGAKIKDGTRPSYVFRVQLSIKGKPVDKAIHSMVWEAFNGELPEGYGIIHINGMKSDCSLSNLKAMTKKDVSLYFAGKTKRTRYVIDRQTNRVYIGCAAAAKALKKSQSAVNAACRGEVKSNTRLRYLKKRPYGLSGEL